MTHQESNPYLGYRRTKKRSALKPVEHMLAQELTERDIWYRPLQSAQRIIDALQEAGYEIVPGQHHPLDEDQ